MEKREAKRQKVTIRQLQQMRAKGERIVALGVYESVTASVADEIGFHIFMTGPSGPMSLFGHTNPTQISFEEQPTTLRAVTRVARYALINAHMPFLSYQATPVPSNLIFGTDTSSPHRPSSTMRIFSSDEYCLRVARRMSWTTFSAGSFDGRGCCLIFAPVNVTTSQKLSLLQSARSVQ